MYVYDMLTPDSLYKNRVLLCYRNQKHAENAVKSILLRLTHILLHETLKCYYCYILDIRRLSCRKK